VLMLKLEGARLALLRRDTASFQSLLSGAQTWLEQYYIGSDSRVAAARSELERLRGLELDPELPVPQKALTRLRAVSR
jgi:uroporphyrin-III C-methyltransferase